MEKVAEGLIPKGALAALKEEIGLPTHGQSVFYFSEKWSMHELISYLLTLSGAATVRISSFSISEDAVRSFVALKEAGLLLELTVLFDYTTKTHKANLMHFVHNVAAEVRTYPNHSKMVLVEGEKASFSVVSSQNLNKNHRVECGAVSSDKLVFSKMAEKFNFYFEKSQKLWN